MSGFAAGLRMAIGLIESFRNAASNLSLGMAQMSTAGTIGMDAIKQGVVGMGGVFLALGGIVAIAATAVAVGFGVHAVRAFGDFQQSVTKLFTTASELHQNLQMVGDGMLSMAGSVGTGAQQLANAMYFVESGGYHGAAGLEVLRVAAMGAKAENADLNGVAKVLTFTMNAYAGTHMTAATAMNTLIASTARGTMTLGELSGAVSNVLPAAAHFGISLIDVGAALATMTSQGDKADSAATHLRQMILALEAPSKIGAAALKSVGLSTQQVSDEMKVSLPATLQMITDAVGKKFPVGSAAYNAAIRDIAGGSKQMMGFLELTGTHLKTFQDNVNGVSDAVKKGGTSIMGWSDVQANLNFKLDAAKAAFGSLAITVGAALAPAITQLLGQITPLVTQFTQWLVTSGTLKNAVNLLAGGLSGLITGVSSIVGFFQRFEVASALLKATLIVLAAVIGIAMVTALYSYAAAAYVAAAANIAAFWPVYLVILAVVAVVALVILAVQHWGEIAHWIQGVWGATVNWFRAAWGALSAWFMGLLSSIGTFFVNIWNGMITWFHSAFGALGAWFTGIWNGIRTTAVNVWNTIVNTIRNVVQGVITWLESAWNNCVQAIANAFLWLYNHNHYFHDLVNIIRSTVQGVIDWLRSAWTTIVAWVGEKWHEMVALAQSAWDGVRNVFAAVWGWMSGIFSSIWSNISSWWNTAVSQSQSHAQSLWDGVKGVWNAVWGWMSGIFSSIWANITSWWNTAASGARDKATTLWQNVSSVFSSAWGTYISGPLTSLAGSIGNFFSGLASQAFSWGANVVQSIADGINSMVGAAGAAAQNVISTVASFLGFHSPAEEGPGRYLMDWGPGLVGGFTAGIVQSLPMVEIAARAMVAPIPQAVGSVAAAPVGPVARVSGGSSGMEETNTLLRQLIRTMEPGRRLTDDELIHAVGARMADRVQQYRR